MSKFIFDILREPKIKLKFEGDMKKEYQYILKNIEDLKAKDKQFNNKKEFDKY